MTVFGRPLSAEEKVSARPVKFRVAASPEAEKAAYDQAFLALKELRYADAAESFQSVLDRDPDTEGFGLWPTVQHTKMGAVRVDGLPVHLFETDWRIERGAPCLGEHTEEVLTELLGLSSADVARLREEGVV